MSVDTTTHTDYIPKEFSVIYSDAEYRELGYVVLNLRPSGAVIVKSFTDRHDLLILLQQVNNMNIWASKRPPGYQYPYIVQPVSLLSQELLDSLNEGG